MPLLVLVDPKVQGGGFEGSRTDFRKSSSCNRGPGGPVRCFSCVVDTSPCSCRAEASMLAKRQAACKLSQFANRGPPPVYLGLGGDMPTAARNSACVGRSTDPFRPSGNRRPRSSDQDDQTRQTDEPSRRQDGRRSFAGEPFASSRVFTLLGTVPSRRRSGHVRWIPPCQGW